MSTCAHVDETEDLALGISSGAAAMRARDHLRACASCRAEYDVFVAESRLFGERAACIAPPQGLAAAIAASAAEGSLDSPAGRLARASRGLVAALACAAAIAGVARLDRTHVCDVPSVEAPSAPTEPAFEEPLACALPASGVVHASFSKGSDDSLACVASLRATCEERAVSIAGP